MKLTYQIGSLIALTLMCVGPVSAQQSSERDSNRSRSGSERRPEEARGQRERGDEARRDDSRRSAERRSQDQRRSQDPRRSAEQRRSEEQRRSQDRQRSAQQQRRPGQSQASRVSGDIVQTKKVDIRSTDRQHLVALVKTNNGRRVAVDLGATDRFGNNPPKKGDRVTIQGRVVRIGDRNVVLGDRFQSGSRVVNIERRRSGSRSDQDRRTASNDSRQDRGRGQADRRRSGDDRQASRGESGQRRQNASSQREPAGALGVLLMADQNARGVRVRSVLRGSPAAEAGIRAGDVIRSVNGQPVQTISGLIARVASQEPGKEVEVTVNRSGQQRTLSADLAARREVFGGSQRR